jgi:hypothetical protein
MVEIRKLGECLSESEGFGLDFENNFSDDKLGVLKLVLKSVEVGLLQKEVELFEADWGVTELPLNFSMADKTCNI